MCVPFLLRRSLLPHISIKCVICTSVIIMIIMLYNNLTSLMNDNPPRIDDSTQLYVVELVKSCISTPVELRKASIAS